MPRISVLLPVHNAQRYLRAALDSVLAQTFGDFELLALDDGSTDRSLSILREYERKDGRVRVFSRENRGLVYSLNQLVAISRAPYLARMDADDICEPRRFEHQIDFLKSNPGHVVVGGWVLLINELDMPISPIKQPCSHDEIDQQHLKGHTSICHPAAMMLKEAVLFAGGYNQEFYPSEDLDLWLRLAELGKIANIPEIVIRYRLHDASISARSNSSPPLHHTAHGC